MIRDKPWPEVVELILEKNNEQSNKGFKEWLMTKEHIGYYIDYFMWMLAYGIQKKITTEDNDHFTVICGTEGSGKTVLALLLGALVSPTLSMKHICFSIHDFLAVIKDAKPGETIILDEGAIFLFSREGMSKDNRKVIKAFNLIRQLNLHLVICIPNYYNLDTYIRKHRVDSLIQIRKSKDTYRGISKKAIIIINQMENKIRNVTSVKIPYGSFWDGYWGNKYPEVNDITESEYRRKKREHLDQYIDEMRRQAKVEEELIVSMVKVSEFEKLVPQSHEVIIRNIMKGLIPGRKIGNVWYVDGQFYREIRGLGGNDGVTFNNTEGKENRETTSDT